MSIRILHVGVGVRGRHWLDLVARYPETVSVACVEPHAETLASVKAEFGSRLEYFSDLDAALDGIEADAALIASPSPLHAEHAELALERGLGVMIEKPFASNLEEARRVNEKGAACGKPVLVAEQFRYVPAERTVRRAVRDGLLGAISNVSFTDRRRQPLGDHGAWVKDVDYPQLQEIAVHHFDSLLSFFDKRPVRVSAHAWNPSNSDYSENACTEALIELEDGLHVQYLGTLTSAKFAYGLRIEGERGDLWTNRKFVLWRARGKKFFRPLRKVQVPKGDEAPYPAEGTTSLLQSLVAAIRDGVEPETRGTENIWAIAMMYAGIVSDQEGRSVPIEEIYAPGA